MTVNSFIRENAEKLILKENEHQSIKTSIETLQKRLQIYFGEDVKEMFMFGSYTRHTILPRNIDENSDVDYMIVFDNSKNLKPQTFLDRLKRFAEAKYATSEIYQSFPTIVLELCKIKFELVPAYKFCGLYYIPNGNGGWMITSPNDFNKQLTETNNANSYKIKPLIRMMKHWNINVNYRGLSSFRIEERIANQMRYAYIYYSSYVDYAKSAFSLLKDITNNTEILNRINRAIEKLNRAIEYENNGQYINSILEIEKVFPEV